VRNQKKAREKCRSESTKLSSGSHQEVVPWFFIFIFSASKKQIEDEEEKKEPPMRRASLLETLWARHKTSFLPVYLLAAI